MPFQKMFTFLFPSVTRKNIIKKKKKIFFGRITGIVIEILIFHLRMHFRKENLCVCVSTVPSYLKVFWNQVLCFILHRKRFLYGVPFSFYRSRQFVLLLFLIRFKNFLVAHCHKMNRPFCIGIQIHVHIQLSSMVKSCIYSFVYEDTTQISLLSIKVAR